MGRKRPLHGLLVGLLILACLGIAGCPSLPYSHTDELKQLEKLKRENARLDEQLEEKDRQITQLARQVKWGHDLTDAQRKQLIVVSDIVLGKFTGGVNTDGKAGDDGVKVYVRPVDSDGSALKAAGELTVELFDLSLPKPDRRIGRWQFDPATLRKEWSSSFIGAFYSLTLPWRGSVPANAHLTLRVQFTDLLTGRGFVKQTDFDVKLGA